MEGGEEERAFLSFPVFPMVGSTPGHALLFPPSFLFSQAARGPLQVLRSQKPLGCF